MVHGVASHKRAKTPRTEKLYLSAVWKELLRAGWTLNEHHKRTNQHLNIECLIFSGTDWLVRHVR